MDGHRRTLAFVGLTLALGAAFAVGLRFDFIVDNIGCITGDGCSVSHDEVMDALSMMTVAVMVFLLGVWSLVAASYPRDAVA